MIKIPIDCSHQFFKQFILNTGKYTYIYASKEQSALMAYGDSLKGFEFYCESRYGSEV